MTSASQPLVSIVTPVYNGAVYLSECIESVLAQTHQNWDYTIVNNCSTDNSAEIARRYAAKDARIRIHDNSKFLRVIPNHNAALRLISPASGYCKMVFADDWMFPECLEQMVSLAEEYPSAAIVGGYVLQGREVICTGLPYSSKVVRGLEICRQHFLKRLYVFGSANAVLYRSALVRERDPFFNEANIHGDTEACFAILKNRDFGFVHQVLTFTRVRPGSLTMMSSDLQTSLAGILQNLVKHGPDYLTGPEIEECLESHLAAYYRFLGKSLLLRDEKAIDYHRKKLIEAGIGFGWWRVVKGALAVLSDLALNPKNTIEKLLKVEDKTSFPELKKEMETRSNHVPVRNTPGATQFDPVSDADLSDLRLGKNPRPGETIGDA
jgi:glycosyltransferase involved in cell wall biosynthesis